MNKDSVMFEMRARETWATDADVLMASAEGGLVTLKCVGAGADGIRVVTKNITEYHIDNANIQYSPDGRDVKLAQVGCLMGHLVRCKVNVKDNGDIVMSRRDAQKETYDWFVHEHKIGQVIECIVQSVSQHGIYVDIGNGVTAKIPMMRAALSKRENLYMDFRKGQKLLAIFYRVGDEGQLYLSMKELLGTFRAILANKKEGDLLDGVVTDITPYGAFVEITPNLTMLVGLNQEKLPSIGEVCSISVTKLNLDEGSVRGRIEKSSISGKKWEMDFREYYKYYLDAYNGDVENWRFGAIWDKDKKR